MLSFTIGDKLQRVRAEAESLAEPGSEVRGHGTSPALCFSFCIDGSHLCGWVKVKENLTMPCRGAQEGNGLRKKWQD